MPDLALTVRNPDRQQLVTEGGGTLDAVPMPFSPSAGAGSSFVWRPGGTPADGVFVTWAALAAALATLDPAAYKDVAVDTSLSAGVAHITAGIWNVENTRFQTGNTAQIAVVEVDDGAHLVYEHLYFFNIEFVNNGTTSPVTTLTNAGAELFLVASVLSLGLGATQPFIEVGAGAIATAELAQGSVLAPDALAMTDASANIGVAAYGSTVESQAVGGTGTLLLVFDGASQPNVTNVQTVGTLRLENLDPQPTFVFQPGGTAGGNVFTDWDLLYAAASLSKGAVNVVIDTSLGAAHITAGTYNLNYWELVSVTGAGGLLTIDTGVTLTPWDVLTLTNVSLQNAAGSATTPVTVPAGKVCTCILYGTTGGIFGAAGSNPIFEVQSGGAFNAQFYGNMQLGLAAVQVLQVDVGASSSLRFADSSTLAATALSGGGTFNVRCISPAASISQTQPGATGTVNYLFPALSTQVTYTPGTAGNWNPVPTKVNAALDQLASPNEVVAATNTGTGTATVTAGPTGNITKARSGKVLVIATLAGESTGPGTITGQLVRDAGTNIGNTAAVTALSANDAISMTLLFVDTLPDTAAHTYKATFTAGAGNVTAAATSAQIVAVEL